MVARFCPALACAVLAALAPPARAQRARPAQPLGSVRGIVFDSLIGRPLPGARVWVQGTDRSAVTDGGGRFRLDSLRSGQAILHYEHDELDSIGLSDLAQRIEVAPGRLTVVELTTPSQVTIRNSICRGEMPVGVADSAVVLGSVRDANRGDRLAGAVVRFSWVAVRRQGPEGPIDILRPSRDVRSDDIGNFYACGVPGDIIIAAQVFAGSASSGITELLVGPRGVARHDITVAREGSPGAARDTAGLRRGLATLMATVRTEDGRPRPSARVSVDDTPVERLTNEDGLAVLDGLPSGSHMAMARMIGYSAQRRLVHLRDGDTLRLELRVREVTVLDTLQVIGTSARASLYLDELQQRLRTGGGAAAWQAIAGEELQRLQTPRSIYQQFQGMRVTGQTPTRFQLYSGINCPVTVFIDGQRADVEQVQSYRPEQLVAVEYFVRGSQAPAWAVSQSYCGTVLVWTRFMR